MVKRAIPRHYHQKGLILLLLLQCCCIVAYAQGVKQIRGKVTDQDAGPLPGVNVTLKGTTTGAITNAEGIYTLNVPIEGGSLIFSFIGYKSQEIPIGNGSVIDVSLKADEAMLDEVVIVGYGAQSRETVTTSITKLDNKVLENIPYANAASALQGALSGVRVQSTSGQPGAAPRIIVRGGTSINNPNGASPLYIIDGILRTNMNDISPDDIESLQVLKDAASTAIYGARGSNGVVIITTKTGKAGKTRVNYSYDFTISEPGKLYDLASARDYIYFGRLGTVAAARKSPATINRLGLPIGYGTGNNLTNNTAFTTQYLTPENQHKLNEGWESMPDPTDPSKTIIFKDTDFQRAIFRTAHTHNHHVSLSGGTDKGSFNAGIGYLNSQGTAITTRFDRLTFNLNGDLKVRNNMSVFGRTMYTRSGNNEVFDLAQIFYRSASTPPTTKFTFEDGSLAPGQSRSIGNAVYHLNNDKRKNSREKLTLSVGGRWDILPGLSFEPQVSLYKETDDAYAFIPAYWNGTASRVVTRSASSSYSRMMQWQGDGVFSYFKTVGQAHNFDVKAGISYFGRQLYSLSGSGQGAATDLIPTLNASPTPVAVGGAISDQVILGYFSRVNYDYKQKYLFSLNARYDGASNLGTDHKWGFFPGVSVGWNLHQEEFWSAIPENLLRMKLRASYGVNGNISGLSDFQAQGEYGVGDRYMGVSAIQNTIIPNPALKWEQSKTFNVGTDLGFFNGRLNIMFDYYRRVTENLITSLTLPPSTGFTSIFTNLGSLENRGAELEIGAQILPATAALQWNLSFNASKTNHKILTLPENGAVNNRVGGYFLWDPAVGDYRWQGGLQEGGRIGDLFAWKQIGVYATDEEAKSAPKDMLMTTATGDYTKYGGDAIFQDSDGNSIIDERDRVYMGNPFPVWTGGVTNNLSYRNINLLVRLDYTTGHTIYNYARIFMDGNWQGDGNLTREMVEKSWKKPGDNATMPAYAWGTGNYSLWRGSANHQTTTNSLYYEKGDFLCVREVTLSFTIPSTILQKAKLSNLRLNVTGSNLYYLTGYKGLNPEEGGLDTGRYPIPRNITFGASVSF
ncbi:TonB-dependent receptor [Nibrella saemangeumensis]|uniref:TonB-dependent receptor n=1 Tax=Nibrella saemangeumensis TaxID=1084526 RepID=A0ABP8NBH3_9BACT